MKAKKQIVNKYAQLEKKLTIATLLLIAVGCIANIYSTYYNLRFIHDPIDLIYYLRYLLLIGGGFAIGYLFTHKSDTHKGHSELFGAAFYAVLAMTLYWLVDLSRLGIQNLSFPWAKILFEGAPLFAIVGTLLIAYISRHTLNLHVVSKPAKGILIGAFLIYQVFSLGSIIFSSGQSSDAVPWLIALNYLFTPLAITIIAFIIMKNIKELLNRLFYAVFIGTFFSTLYFVLWEFHTDPSYQAANTFSIAAILIAFIVTGILTWQSYKAVR